MEHKLKYCPKCKEEQSIKNFHQDGSKIDGLYYICKSCRSKIAKIFNQKYKKQIMEQKKIYYIKNRNKIKIREKIYRGKNKLKIAERMRQYYIKNKGRIIKLTKKYSKIKRKRDINFKILDCLRRRINESLKNNSKSKRTIKLIGCSIEQLKQHLEKQFKVGMTWDNHGYYGWHIDHIKPCARFDLRKVSEQKKCFHYTNLQPLWAKENLKKSKKIL